jgi:hypothetical protein
VRTKTFRYLGYELVKRASYRTFLNYILLNIRSRLPMPKILVKYEQRFAVQLHRKVFYSFIFTFLVSTFSVFFYFGTFQQETFMKFFFYNLKLAYGFANWSVISITGEYTLLDRLFRY